MKLPEMETPDRSNIASRQQLKYFNDLLESEKFRHLKNSPGVNKKGIIKTEIKLNEDNPISRFILV